MHEDILQCICELESINIAQAELNMGINDKLCKAQNLMTQVEGIYMVKTEIGFKIQNFLLFLGWYTF